MCVVFFLSLIKLYFWALGGLEYQWRGFYIHSCEYADMKHDISCYTSAGVDVVSIF